MTADRGDVAAAEPAFEQGVGEAVKLPAYGDPSGRGFDLAEADSLPAGLFTRRP